MMRFLLFIPTLISSLLGIRAAGLGQERDQVQPATARRPPRPEQLAETLIAHSPDILTVLSSDGTIRYVSPAVESRLGYQPEDLVGKNIVRLIHSDDVAAAQARLEELRLSAMSVRSQELRLRHADGSWQPYEVVGRNLLDQPDVRGLLVSARYLAARHQLDRERAALTTLAAAMRQATGRSGIIRIVLAQLTDLLELDGSALALRTSFAMELEEPAEEAALCSGVIFEAAGGLWHHWPAQLLPAHVGLTSGVLQSRQPLILNAASGGPALSCPEALCGLPAVICLPLSAQEEPVGALYLGRERPFDSNDLHLLTGIGDMVSNALRRAIRHEETRQRAEQLVAVNQLGRLLTENPDPARIYAATSQTIFRLIPEIATLLVARYDPDRELIVAEYGVHEGQEIDTARLPPLPLEEAGAGTQSRVIHTQQPLIINNFPDYVARASVQVHEGSPKLAQSALYAPMLAGDTVVGVLQLQSYVPCRFSRADLDLLSLVANTAAIALQNAQLLTDLQRSNAEVSQVAMELRHLIDDANAPIFGIDAGGRISEWNKAAERITGFSSAEATGRDLIAELIPAGHQESVKEVLAKALAGVSTANYELTLKTSGGTAVLILLNATPRRDPAGQINGVVGVGQDITERKAAEARLRQNARRASVMAELAQSLAEVTLNYQEVLDTVVERVATFYGDTCSLRLVSADGRFLEMVALSNPEPEVREFATALFRERPLRVDEGWPGRVFQTGEPVYLPRVDPVPFRQQATHDLAIYLDVVGVSSLINVPLQARGQRFGTLGVARNRPEAPYTEEDLRFLQDIADRAAMAIVNARLHDDIQRELAVRREAEEALRQSEATNRALLDALPDLLFRLDRHGVVLDMRAGPLAMPIDRDSFVGRRIPDILASFDAGGSGIRQALFAALDKVLATGLSQSIEYQNSDGTNVLYYEIRLFAAGEHEAIAIVRDITADTLAEESLRQTQKLESIGLLAGGIAHDFNNLLTGMLGQTSLAMSKLPAGDPAREHIGKAVKSAQRAADLTRQLLAYAGKGQFQVKSVDLNELIQENKALLETIIPKDVTFELHLAPDLPYLEADKGQIQQVVMNLVMNAAESILGKPGRVLVETSAVTLSADNALAFIGEESPPAGRYICLQVHDTGCGMTPDTLNRIFDPFFSTKEEGRGLGLSATLGIIRSHKGGLQVESKVGSGSQFRVYFPSGGAAPRPLPAEPTAPETAVPGVVLVIDDEEPVREAVVDILEVYDLKVLTAANGRDGLAMFEKHRSEIGVILLDMQMPVMNGEETFRKLRQIDPDAKVIFSSGYSEAEATRRFVGDELVAFLQKPYAIEQLLNLVQSALQRH